MALVRTALGAAISANATIWPIVNTTIGFPVVGAILSGTGQPVLVDSELAFLVTVLAPGLIQVRSRGAEGTKAEAHDVNTPVITSANPLDFPINVPGAAILRPLSAPDIDSYGQNGPIVIPVQDTKAYINGTSAVTLALGPPSLAAYGVELVISSNTPFPHVITAPGLFQSATVGEPFSNITLPALIGAGVWLIGSNGFWTVQNQTPGVAFS